MKFVSVRLLPGDHQAWIDPNKVMIYKAVVFDPKAPAGAKTLLLLNGAVPFYLADEWKDVHSRLNSAGLGTTATVQVG